MGTSYTLARTYAPSADFSQRIQGMSNNTEAFCRAAGVSQSTYTRMIRTGSASRRTARRLACYYALIDGRVAPQQAFELLFAARPQIVMEVSAATGRYQRTHQPCISA